MGSRLRALLCIALVPGALSSVDPRARAPLVSWSSYLREAEEFFKQRSGQPVKKFALPIDGTIEERGLYLRNALESWKECLGRPVDVFAHSQGGLDLRYAIQSLGLKRVRSLVTVGTPHQGTPVAQWAVTQVDQKTRLYRLLKWVARYDLKQLRFAPELTPAFLEEQSAVFARSGAVRSAHVAAVCGENCGKIFTLLRWLTGLDLSAGDGMVPLVSQGWGPELARVSLDHLSEIDESRESQRERERMHQAVWQFFQTAPSGEGK